MSNINRADYDCDECLIEEVAKQQLLADLDAYQMWVEEEDWEKAQDASLNANEILQAFRDEDLTTWKNTNYQLVEEILSNNNQEQELCEICESNEKEYTEGKWCASCKDQFKESENR